MRKLTWAQKRCKLSDSVARLSDFFPKNAPSEKSSDFQMMSCICSVQQEAERSSTFSENI